MMSVTARRSISARTVVNASRLPWMSETMASISAERDERWFRRTTRDRSDGRAAQTTTLPAAAVAYVTQHAHTGGEWGTGHPRGAAIRAGGRGPSCERR